VLIPVCQHPLLIDFLFFCQDPRLFLGTVRQNLDPVSRFTDAQLWRVLEEVNVMYDLL
jgi:ABC-type multidrug transport system fused ATPase/permease subunit